MYLVGIIEKTCNTIEMNRILEKNNIYKLYTISKMNEKNIDNFKNVKFDVIILNYEISFENCKTNIRNILNNSKIVLLNIDYKRNLKIVENIESQVITYGFNKKATVTITSCDEDNIILGVQRGIMNLKKQKIENQELKYPYKTGEDGMHLYTSLLILRNIVALI